MYNRKFINGLKNRYKKGGIKKYQQGDFVDQEIAAYDRLDDMYNSGATYEDYTYQTKKGPVGGRTYIDPKSTTAPRYSVEVGPMVKGEFESGMFDDLGMIGEKTYAPTLNVSHDKFNTYSPLTRDIQLKFEKDPTAIPEYLKTLSDVDLHVLIKDMKDNDVMGMSMIEDIGERDFTSAVLNDELVYTDANTNPGYTQALFYEAINRNQDMILDQMEQAVAIQDQLAQAKQNLIDIENQPGMSTGDKWDIGLSTAGMTPGLGIVPDVINFFSNLGQSGYDLITGDWDEFKHDIANTGMAGLSAIPGYGLIFGAGKQVKNINTIVKLGDKSTDINKLNKHRKIVSERLTDISKKKDQFLPVKYKGGPPAVIVKNVDNLTKGGVNFVRVEGAYPIIKYSDEMADIVNNPINKNANKLPWFKREFVNWGDAWKRTKEAIFNPMVPWKPRYTIIKPFGTLVRHISTPAAIPLDIAAGYVIFELIGRIPAVKKAKEDIKSNEDALKYNEQLIEERQMENPIMSPDDFDPLISTGENIYNQMVYSGTLNETKMSIYTDGIMLPGTDELFRFTSPDVPDEDVKEILMRMAPLLWGEDTQWNQKKFNSPQESENQKAFGGYRRQMGGYMGVPQQNVGAQQYVGDEGNYMGQMQQFQTGGKQLPGGNVQQIPGSDAVQFSGQTHNQGGIMMDGQTEVEDGETMDKVNMNKGGGPKDYFFSSHLKKGGKSYAEHHKAILQSGGDQRSVDMLAKMQEKAAGRNPNKVSVSRTGGYKRKYATGGTPERNIYSNEYSDVESIYKNLGYTDLSGGTNWRGIDHGDEGYENTQGKNKQDVNGTMTHTGYYGDIGPAEREGFYNRNREIMESMGVMSWEDFDPLTQTDNFQTKYNAFLTKEYNDNQDLQDALTAKGMTSVQAYIDAVGFTNSGHGSQKIDNFFGSFTHGRTSMRGPEPEPGPDPDCECEDLQNKTTPPTMLKFPCADPDCGCPKPVACTEPIIDEGPCDCDPNMSKDDPCCCAKKETHPDCFPPDTWNPGPLQLLPAAYAFSEGPDYMSEHPMRSPAAIIPERLAKTHLERVDMNADRARNASDARGLNKFIETSGGGSSNIVNKMAAYSKKREADATITDTENKTNIAISNQEAIMDQQRKGQNVDNALDASKFNVTSQSDANKHNSTMEATVDEFNRASDSAVKDRRLMALDNATKTMTGLYTDKLQYDAQERMALAISGQTGIYQREQNKLAYSQQLMGQGIMPGTQQYIDAMAAYGKGQPKVQGKRYGGYRRRY